MVFPWGSRQFLYTNPALTKFVIFHKSWTGIDPCFIVISGSTSSAASTFGNCTHDNALGDSINKLWLGSGDFLLIEP